MTDRLLELNKLGRQYGSEPAVHALVDVNLFVDHGEWLAITGPSGAGKSTLLNVIGCLDRPSSGSYLFEGIETARLTDKQRAGLRSRRIGFVFQAFHLLPYRSVLENVMLAEVYRRQTRRGRRQRALAAIERVGLSHRAEFSPAKLSGGERQRVAIARALVGSPSLLLCDEPTGNLDSKSSASILELFENLNRDGLTLITVTHNEDVANRASRRVHIVDGSLTELSIAPDARRENLPFSTCHATDVDPNTPHVSREMLHASTGLDMHADSKTPDASRELLLPATFEDLRPTFSPSGLGNGYGDQRQLANQSQARFEVGHSGDQAVIFDGRREYPSQSNGIGIGYTRSRSGVVARSGITIGDLLSETLAGMFARPGRMMLTVLGIVIGLTALVATLGLTRTAGNRIISQFDQLAATELFITAKPGPSGMVDPQAIPWDAPRRLARLNGVVAAGTLSEVVVGDALVRSSPVKDPLSQTAFKLSVHAASPELFRAVRAPIAAGRWFDSGHSSRGDRVAVLGPDAAQRLGIVGLQQLPAIFLGDHLYLVVGILRDVARKPELLGSVIIPEGTARHDFGLLGPGTVVVETQIGAAYLIADQSRSALRPDNPRVLKLEVPLEPKRVREEVQSDLTMMFMMLGGLSLVVGAIGIANITLVSVMERTSEIGLRRAIGATRGHIAAQFLFESASMGIIGGILGASLGVIIVIGVSAYQLWTPVLDPAVPFLVPLIGGAIGLISGTYPAMRAARLEPVEAFRN
jgi:ABC-type lipoprotein export system ATPase subunit/cell division protein FtsX